MAARYLTDEELVAMIDSDDQDRDSDFEPEEAEDDGSSSEADNFCILLINVDKPALSSGTVGWPTLPLWKFTFLYTEKF